MRRVRNEGDCVVLGQDLVRINEWSNKWEWSFNTKKCSVLELVRATDECHGIIH